MSLPASAVLAILVLVTCRKTCLQAVMKAALYARDG